MTSNLFTNILTKIKAGNKEIHIYLINGIKLAGNVVEFDENSVLISRKNVESQKNSRNQVQHDNQLVERRAVSTISFNDAE